MQMQNRNRRRWLTAIAVSCVLTLLFPSAGFAVQDDCGTGGDASNNRAAPTTLEPIPSSCEGGLVSGEADTADWYGLALRSGQHVRLAITVLNPPAAAGLTLVDPTDADRTTSFNSSGQVACSNSHQLPDTCDLRLDRSGVWKLGVIRQIGDPRYRIDFVLSAPQADCADPTLSPDLSGDAVDDAPASGANQYVPATTIVIPEISDGLRKAACEADFDIEDRGDNFRFLAVKGTKLSVTTPPFTTANISDPNGKIRFDEQFGDQVSGLTNVLTIDASGYWLLNLVPTIQFIVVYPQHYTLTLEIRQIDCTSALSEAPEAPPGLALTPVWAPGGASQTCKGALDPNRKSLADPTLADTRDVISFDGDAGSPVSLTMDVSAGNCFELTIAPPSGSPTVRNVGDTCGGASTSFGSAGVTGTWNLTIRWISGVGGQYILTPTGIVIPEADCNVAGDAGDTFGTARTLPLSVDRPRTGSCSGNLRPRSGPADVDYYSLAGLPASAVIDVAATRSDTSNAAGPTVCLWRPNNTPVAGECAASIASTRIAESPSEAGDWRISVTSATVMAYQIQVTVILQDDCGIDADAGNTRATASTVTLPELPTHSVPVVGVRTLPLVCADDVFSINRFVAPENPESGPIPVKVSASLAHVKDSDDWYKFTTAPTHQIAAIVVTLIPGGALSLLGNSDFDLCVVDPTGQTTCASPRPGGQPEITLDHACTVSELPSLGACHGSDGPWYVHVRYVAGNLGRYDLVIGEAHA